MSNKIIPPSYEGRKRRKLDRVGARLPEVLAIAKTGFITNNRAGVRDAMRLAKKRGAPRTVGRGLVR